MILTLAEAARFQAEQIMRSESAIAAYEIGELRVPRAVAEHLDIWLARERRYGVSEADVSLIGPDA